MTDLANIRYTEDSRKVFLVEAYLDNKVPESFVRQITDSHYDLQEMFDNSDIIKKSAYMFPPNCYLYYQVDNKNYVDLLHILSNLKMYPELSQEFWNQNTVKMIWDIKFDGSVLRRYLIDLDTMQQIILSSSSPFSQVFKLEMFIYVLAFYLAKLMIASNL